MSTISSNILAARLRHLEAEGLVLAVPYSDRPRRYSYELTEPGRDLGGAVRMLSQWSADHAGRPGPDATEGAGGAGPGASPGDAGTPRHELCGTPMEAVWWCPTCGEQRGGSEGPEAVWV